MRLAGKTLREIAAALQVAQTTLTHWMPDLAGRISHAKQFTEARAAEARRLRAQGMTWKQVGAALGIHGHTAQYWADTAYRERRRARIAENARIRRDDGGGGEPRNPIRLPDVEHETLTARLMGDPLPGMSALDRQRGAE